MKNLSDLLPLHGASRPGLVVQWLRTQIILSEVRFHAGVPRVVRSVTLNHQEEYCPSDPQVMGMAIRRKMDQVQMTPGPAVIALPRQTTIVRTVNVAEIPNSDIPQAVALHIEEREHTLNRELSYDYLLHRTESGQASFATLVACPRNITQGIVASLEAAGINADTCCLAELCLGQLIKKSHCDSFIMLLAGEMEMEAVFIHRQRPVTTVTMRMPADIRQAAQQMDSLCRRLQDSLPGDLTMSNVGRVYVLGRHTQALVRQINDPRVSRCPLEDGAEDDAGLIHAVCLDGRSAEQTIDLLHPKLPVSPHRTRRRQLIRRVVPVTAVLLLAATLLLLWHQSLQADLHSVTTRIDRNRQILQHAESLLAQWNALSRWQFEQSDVSRELLRLHSHLPDQERIYLTRLRLENIAGREAAVLRLDGVAKETADVMQFNHRLLNDRYQLKLHGIEPATRDAQFRSQFQVETTLPHHQSYSKPGES
ncbi:MAG: hypothetical protein MK110_18460 [Fuerstiella sp.]|nr:hypothetical protein [Fuerstiella sp.]